MDRSAQTAATAFARDIAALFDRRLGVRLAGAYLIGSLAHGGFSARYSDIDVAVMVEDPLSAEELGALRQDAASCSAELAAKLSIFWSEPSFAVGRFPPLDRVDYLDHAVVLRERRRLMPPRPTLSEVRSYLAGATFENWSQDALRFGAASELKPKDRKRFVRALLYPARFIYSWETGKISGNDDAVAFVRDLKPAGLDLDVIARALDCRNAGRDPDELFPERAKLPGLVEACREVVSRT